MPIVPGNKPGIWQLFFLFLRSSATTPGGGYALIAVLGRELAARGWLTHHQFTEIFALVQAVPGPVGFNTSVVIGKRLHGYYGATLCALGTLLPPFILILMANTLFTYLPDSTLLDGAIQGSYAVALGFVATMAWKVIWTYRKLWYWLLIAGVSCAVMIFVPDLFLASFVITIALLYGLVTWKQ